MAVNNFLGAFGHVALDIICSVSDFPKPNTCEAVIDKKMEFGGTAGNLAVHASSLGVKTALASYVGGDFPGEYRKFLKSKGIDLTDLITIKDGRTSTVIMVSDDSHNQMGFVDQGVMLDQGKFPIQDHTISSSEIVHVGTGRPKYALQVCKRAKKEGKRVAFDPAQEIHYVYEADSFAKVIKESDMFFCNESELKVALDYLGLRHAEDLLDTVDIVINTLGKHGSRILVKDGERIDVPLCKAAKVVDTTGAGDAYRAGFYAGLSRDYDLAGCGALASAAASFAVESYGGQTNLATWKAVQRRAFRKN